LIGFTKENPAARSMRMLRDIAARGPWVSAHPDTILALGAQKVLYRTRHLGWGADTHLYRSAAELRRMFPPRLPASGPRVLKRNRAMGARATIVHTAAPFQVLRAKMEGEWTPQMIPLPGFDKTSLPVIWDAEFLYGPCPATGEDSYVLCEINVGSVLAIPDAGACGDRRSRTPETARA
jgi:hypothetical protein